MGVTEAKPGRGPLGWGLRLSPMCGLVLVWALVGLGAPRGCWSSAGAGSWAPSMGRSHCPPPLSPSLLPSHSSSLPFFLKLCGALKEEADQINIFSGSSQNGSFLRFHFVFRDNKLGLCTAGCDLLEPPAHCGRFHKQSCFVCCPGKNRIISFNGTSGRL